MKLQDLIANTKKPLTNYYTPDSYGRDFPRLPTGIFSLDFALGGGFPIGVTSSLWGGPNSGKTLVASCLISSAQNICWKCFEYLWDCQCETLSQKTPVIEQTERFDLNWGEKFGVDSNNIHLFEHDIGEEAVDTVYACLCADDCGLVVLDSMSRVIPESEITESALKNCMGDRAQLHTRLMNKVKSALIAQKQKGNAVCFVAINQERANVIKKSRYEPDSEMQGCYAARHDFHLTCKLDQLKAEEFDENTSLPTVGKFKANMIAPGSKRKLFILNGTAWFYVGLKNDGETFAGDIIDVKSTLSYAENVKLIQRKNGYVNVFDDLKFKTQKEMFDYWKENQQYYLSLKRKIIDYYVKAEKGLIEMPEKKEEVQEDEIISSEDS